MSDWTPEQLASLEPAALEQAVRALVVEGAEAVPLLQQAAALAGTKDARKALRRGLHQLRSRGIEVGPEARGPREPVLRPVEERGDVAFLGPIDPLGTRLALLVTLEPGEGRLAQLVVSDRAGVVHLELRRGRRRDVRGFLREVRTSRSGPVEVEARSLRALLRALQADRPAPPGSDPGALAALLAGPPAPTPGERVRTALGDVPLEESEALARLDARVESGALVRWLLGGEALDELAGQLVEAEESPLVLSELHKRERAAQLVEEGAPRVLDAETRERLARRLEETAALWQRRGDTDGAVAAVRMAALVREADGPRRPYLRGLLEASLELARARRREESKDRVVVPR